MGKNRSDKHERCARFVNPVHIKHGAVTSYSYPHRAQSAVILVCHVLSCIILFGYLISTLRAQNTIFRNWKFLCFFLWFRFIRANDRRRTHVERNPLYTYSNRTRLICPLHDEQSNRWFSPVRRLKSIRDGRSGVAFETAPETDEGSRSRRIYCRPEVRTPIVGVEYLCVCIGVGLRTTV